VIEASNLPQALDHIRNSTIDLVLVGTGRSSLAALDSLKAAREASPATRFAVVSASDTRADILATLAAGFHGFISKSQSDTRFSPPLRTSWLGEYTYRHRSPRWATVVPFVADSTEKRRPRFRLKLMFSS
jgi:DNA-binding NarL/FixJ family response regulator